MIAQASQAWHRRAITWNVTAPTISTALLGLCRCLYASFDRRPGSIGYRVLDNSIQGTWWSPSRTPKRSADGPGGAQPFLFISSSGRFIVAWKLESAGETSWLIVEMPATITGWERKSHSAVDMDNFSTSGPYLCSHI
jgi:hypothetical protein